MSVVASGAGFQIKSQVMLILAEGLRKIVRKFPTSFCGHTIVTIFLTEIVLAAQVGQKVTGVIVANVPRLEDPIPGMVLRDDCEQQKQFREFGFVTMCS